MLTVSWWIVRDAGRRLIFSALLQGLVMLMPATFADRAVVMGGGDRHMAVLHMVVPGQHPSMSQTCCQLIERDGEYQEQPYDAYAAHIDEIQSVFSILEIDHIILSPALI
ncbi:MAG: hypothetical protein APF80_06470 [Alphaproteobacteria bacterium BRH_c36]|nr:MAG: hypothetical protein APF80_06470 [Alphaproteobacteria bacterium BRH_c36]